ncbi:MAG: BACON domain-containing protein [Bacteroidales bacterium]|jgi:hypothetical protein|nr:BACON domain-containing protein [Bacteroidales bacterium]
MKTNILKLATIFLILVGGLTSCKDKDKPFLKVDEIPIVVTAESGEFFITVKSNGEWTAVVENAENHAWCTLFNASGVNDGVITVNIAENTDRWARIATIKITSGSLTKSVIVYQEEVEGNCEDELFYYYDDEKIFYVDQLFLDEPFLKDWLLVGFVPQADDAQIVNYINQTGLFKSVGASDIFYHANLERLPNDSHMMFVNTKEQNTCKELKEIIRTLKKSPIVAFANITLGYEICMTPGNCTNILSWSKYFFVKVKDKNDLSDLYAVMQKTNTQLIEQDPFMPDWFMLSADKKSMSNALRMSQYFHETGKFVASEPSSIGSLVNR